MPTLATVTTGVVDEAAPVMIFDEEPVSLDEFVQGRRYLNAPRLSAIQYEVIRAAENIYRPETRGLLARSRDPEIAAYWAQDCPQVNDIVVEAGKGSGKDLICQVLALRVAYLLLCLRSPGGYFGTPAESPLHLVNVAASAKQASDVFFGPVVRFARRPGSWFADHLGRSKDTGALRFSIGWGKSIEAISGNSEAGSQEGLNVILGVADEVDEFADLALIDTLRSSAVTRFPEAHKIVSLSWPRHKGSAIQVLGRAARKEGICRRVAERRPVQHLAGQPAALGSGFHQGIREESAGRRAPVRLPPGHRR
jgi:hypothetical protein